MAEKGVDIAPAEGKLGILLVGLGAVSTTVVAGVEAIRRGLAQPVGSLTQMGTIRLGKRTDNRSPKIKDFVPLASIDDIVFGAWDIFTDNAFEAAMNAGVLEKELEQGQRFRPQGQLRPVGSQGRYAELLTGTDDDRRRARTHQH